MMENIDESTYPNHMIPETYEQKYYYQIFSNNFIDKNSNLVKYILPRYWMPNFVKGAKDSSARTLKVYQKKVLKN